MLASFLGVAKAGHPYIPVDAGSPAKRLCDIEKKSKACFCIALEKLPETVSMPGILDRQMVNTIFQRTHQFSKIDHFVTANDCFYIIFTSGTTGSPKGVQITHDNLLDFVNWMSSGFGLTAHENCLVQPLFSFDLSVMAIYPSLFAGRKMVALPKETATDFKELFAVLPKLEINEWISTPSFMEVCMLSQKFSQETLPGLKQIIFCGEELLPHIAKQVKNRFPNAHIYNTYGPTETTVAKTSIEISDKILQEHSRLPIGYAAPGTDVLLLDQNDQLDPAGEMGEIVILGPGVSKGYVNEPQKTANVFKFMNDRFAYKTGDLGRIETNGLIFYHGRKDFQVKLHGYRIELEDVDHHLQQLPEIRQAVTIPEYTVDGQIQRLAAYVVLQDGNIPQNQFHEGLELKKALADTTMDYMIPARFIFTTSLPLTSNGKVDRKTLMMRGVTS